MPTELHVSALEAETRLAVLLELVAQGRTVTILRRGQPVARLGPAGPDGAAPVTAMLDGRPA